MSCTRPWKPQDIIEAIPNSADATPYASRSVKMYTIWNMHLNIRLDGDIPSKRSGLRICIIS